MATLLNRRRYMGDKVYNENSYIQDGLVFQLDGINKGAADGTWVDLKGGWVFSANNGAPQSVTNGFYFDGASSFSNPNVYPANTDYTIEVCCYGIPIGHAGTWAEGNWMLYQLGSSMFFLQRKPSVVVDKSIYNRINSFSYNTESAIVNKTALQFGGANFFSDPSITEIGHYRSGYYTGIWYAFRIYNRKLTAEEQQHNIKVDSQRFKFKL